MDELTDSNFKKALKGNAVVDFYADWCGPCKMMAPVVEELSAETKTVAFYKLNVDNNDNATTINSVRSLPTFIFFKDGVEVYRHVGAAVRKELKDKVNKYFG